MNTARPENQQDTLSSVVSRRPWLDEASRIDAVHRLGYTAAAAAFFVRVASVGGHFVRPQLRDALGRQRGRAEQDVMKELLARRHASVRTYCHSAQVVRLSHPLLLAAGEALPARATRARPVLALRSRLMALDVALARSDVLFAASDERRLALCDRLGVDRTCVPTRRYRPGGTPIPAGRVLMDTHLVGVAGGDAGTMGRESSAASGSAVAAHQPRLQSHLQKEGTPSHPVLVLGYIDEGDSAAHGFRAFLRTHSPMLETAPRWCVIYAGLSSGHVDAARRTFDAEMARAPGRAARLLADAREYCRLRELYEAERWSELRTASLQRYFDLRDAIGPAGETAFQAWRERGDAGVEQWMSAWSSAPAGELDVLVINRRYTAIESLRRAT